MAPTTTHGQPAPAGTGLSSLCGGDLTVTASRHGGLDTLTVAGDLDLQTAPRLVDAAAAVVAHRPVCLIVDMTPTRFLSAAGISALLALHDAHTPTGVFCLVAHGSSTARPLHLMGINNTISIYPTHHDATAAMHRALTPETRRGGEIL